jgi:hypothetical protein
VPGVPPSMVTLRIALNATTASEAVNCPDAPRQPPLAIPHRKSFE